MSSTDNPPNWKIYEQQVYQELSAKYPSAKFDFNVKVKGRFSETKRQIDILITLDQVGHELQGIVDCKHYKSKVDVKTVEAFIGLMNDVGTEFGLIFTEAGFTKAAERRAASGRVKLDILALKNIPDYEIPIDWCEICEPNSENWPSGSNFIDWTSADSLDVEGDTSRVAEIGYCTWCNQLYVRCKCGTPNALPEFGGEVECEGGCGTRFAEKSRYVGDGLTEPIICVNPGYPDSC